MALYEASLVARIPASSGAPTLTEIGPVKFTGLSWVQELGDGRADINAKVEGLDTAVKARLTQIDQTPNELWIHRAGTRVFAGPVVSYQIQNRKVITLHAFGLPYYLRYMVRDGDYFQTALDQGLIVKDLLDTYQAQAYGHFGLDTTIPATGTNRDLTVLGREGKTLQSIIATMGARDNGFDLDIDPFTRRVTLYTPRRGVDLSASIFLDRRGILQPNVALSVAAGLFAVRSSVASSSAGSDVLTSSAVNSAAEARFGRVMRFDSFSDVTVQTTLDNHASRVVADYATPSFAVTPQFAPVTGVGPTDIDPGDTITYDYDIGLGAQTFARRVAQITTTVSRGKERMAVTFL